MDSMRPPANAIDQAYLCARAERGAAEAAGGTVLPAALLVELLDTLSEEVPEDLTVPARDYIKLFRGAVLRALQGGELAVPVSVTDLHTLAALAGATTLSSEKADIPTSDNVILFPLQDQSPYPLTASEPA